MVPKAGLEPARISTVDFESTASTDFATSALKRMRKTLGIIPLQTRHATGINGSVRQALKKAAFPCFRPRAPGVKTQNNLNLPCLLELS
jgi:hypothetical protein